MPRYYSAYDFDRETAMLDGNCGWHGQASQASIEVFDVFYELGFLRCDVRLADVGLPTRDEVRRAAGAGAPRVRFSCLFRRSRSAFDHSALSELDAT